MPNEDLLVTSQLSIGYTAKKSKVCLFDHINLNIKQGRLTTLIGINGIGKSTLLRTLSGIQKPLSGTVFLNDENIHKMSLLTLAQNLSVVLTEKLPPSQLNVWELIALGRQPYTNWLGALTQEDINSVNQAIALTEIEHLVSKRYYVISDGQLQIVLIARALAQDTPLIILDEPSTHLDLLHKVKLFKLLKRLSQQTGKSIVFSTHDVDMAIQMSDDMIVMTPKGIIQDQVPNIIEQGVFETLFEKGEVFFDNERGKFIIA